MNELVILYENEARVSSKVLSDGFGIQHKNLIELIKKYKNEFEATSRLKKDVEITIAGRESKSFLLNEEQVTFLGTIVRNNPKTIKFKRMIITEFYRMKNYIIEQEQNQLPQTKIELIEAWLNSEKEKIKIIDENAQLQIENKVKDKKIIEDEPKIDFFDKTSDTKTLFSMSKTAKILGIGRNDMMSWMRYEKFLMDSPCNWNMAAQTLINRKYFILKIKKIEKNGAIFNSTTTFVTGKGLQWLQKKYIKKEELI